MKRTGAEGEFRSNLHRGGSAQVVKLSAEERATAVRAAKSMGLNACGVDMLRANHGPVFMEVNSSPGLEGVEKATGLDISLIGATSTGAFLAAKLARSRRDWPTGSLKRLSLALILASTFTPPLSTAPTIPKCGFHRMMKKCRSWLRSLAPQW